MKLPKLSALNPARCWDAGMSPEVLIAAKLAWLLLVCGGFFARVGRPGAAMVSLFDGFPAGAGWLMPVLFAVSGLALLTNQAARTAAVVAGACALLTPLFSIAAWRSHEWICGAILLLAGLDKPGGTSLLVRAQATLCLGVVLFDQTGAVDWTTQATLEGWRVDRDSWSLLQSMRESLPAGMLGFAGSWLVPLSALVIATGLWIQSMRRIAVWCACAWLLVGYLVIGTDTAALFTLATLVAMLAFLDWPRSSIAAHWPRACGWPMWLRIALDHHDYDRRTEWPFPQNPDADLDVWIDGAHLTGRRGIAALLLYFPLFHMTVFSAVILLLLVLPQPWAMVAHVAIGVWLLAFFAPAAFGRPRTTTTESTER